MQVRRSSGLRLCIVTPPSSPNATTTLAPTASATTTTTSATTAATPSAAAAAAAAAHTAIPRTDAREQQRREIASMLEDLQRAQSPDEKRFKQAARTLDQMYTSLFAYSERYHTLLDNLMHWREQLAMVAPHLVAACFSNCRASIGGSADMSPANGRRGATGGNAGAPPPMLLADDHLGGDGRYATRRRAQLVQVARLDACREIEVALVQLVDELCAVDEELTLLREAIFEVDYTAVGMHPHILAQHVKRARERHRKNRTLADELQGKVAALLGGNRVWLDNLVAGLAAELGADVFYDV